MPPSTATVTPFQQQQRQRLVDALDRRPTARRRSSATTADIAQESATPRSTEMPTDHEAM